MTKSQYLQRPEGRVAYDVRGEGPLVVCLPGMGDVRFSYRVLAAELAAGGCTVATMDLRGHGDSDTTFSRYDDVAAGEDAEGEADVAHAGQAQDQRALAADVVGDPAFRPVQVGSAALYHSS